MEAIVKISESSHWYAQDGTPCYEVLNVAQTKLQGKDVFRPTSKRDARKLLLGPSVTGIEGIEAKPGLTRWKIEQGILACLTLPRMKTETDEEFAYRAAADANSVSRKAAEDGTALHGEIERYALACQAAGRILDPPDYRLPKQEKFALAMLGVMDWFKANVRSVVAVEQSFYHPLGYGGKTDAILVLMSGERALYDWKSKSTVQHKAIYIPNDHGTQLVAYAHGVGEPETTRLRNLYVSLTEPGRVEEKDWTDDQDWHWERFQAMHRLWCVSNKYDPKQAMAEQKGLSNV